MATTTVFEPDDPNELLRGWLLHAHKGRDRQDLSARRCDRQRLLLGIPATALSAVVGTATFSALQESPSGSLKVTVGALAVLAAILASLQTFLDLGTRAERHRIAGVRYKMIIRELEQLGIGTLKADFDPRKLDRYRRHLDALERVMPVVGAAVHDRVDAKYRDVAFVDALRR